MKIINQRKITITSSIIIVSILITATFFSWTTPDGLGQTQNDYIIEIAFPNLTFNQPVGLVNSGDGTNRLFVIEQPGVIRCLLYTSPSPRDGLLSRMPSSA